MSKILASTQITLHDIKHTFSCLTPHLLTLAQWNGSQMANWLSVIFLSW